MRKNGVPDNQIVPILRFSGRNGARVETARFSRNNGRELRAVPHVEQAETKRGISLRNSEYRLELNFVSI